MKRGTNNQFTKDRGSRMACRLALAAAALSATASCKREERQFRVPPPAADAPANVAFLNRVRPGPMTPISELTQPPVDVPRIMNEPYKRLHLNNAQAVSDGQTFFSAFNCSGCHAHGGGGIGPPLMDAQWIYGSTPEEIYASIVLGRPNGMPSFRGRMGDYQIWELVAYVRSLSGLANPNAASGREEHMRATVLPPNSTPAEKPTPAPATGPTTTHGEVAP